MMEFALSVLLRGSLLLLLALGFCSVRRLSAADRHAILLWALVAQLVIVATVLAPTPRRDVGVTALPAALAQVSSVRTLKSPMAHRTVGPTAVDEAGTVRDPLSWLFWLCWLAGSGLLLARLAWSHYWARRVVRRATAMEKPGSTATVPYRVGRSAEAEVAFAYGWLRPVIILPADAPRWADQQRQMVLVHEAEHLCRRDGISNSIIEVIRAIFWPNPLVWWVARRARLEAEKAADDAVVREGYDPARYIHGLVGILRARRSPTAALAIHRPGQFESRAASLLDSGRLRGPVRPTRLAPFFSVGTLLAIAAMTLGLTTVDAGPWAEIEDGGRTLRLLSGATVQFEGSGEVQFRDGRQTIVLAPSLRITDASDGEVDRPTLQLAAAAGNGSGWVLRRIDQIPSGPGSRIHDSDGTGTASVRSGTRITFYVQVTGDGETVFFHPELSGP